MFWHRFVGWVVFIIGKLCFATGLMIIGWRGVEKRLISNAFQDEFAHVMICLVGSVLAFVFFEILEVLEIGLFDYCGRRKRLGGI